jgi:cytochrome c peroxidase
MGRLSARAIVGALWIGSAACAAEPAPLPEEREVEAVLLPAPPSSPEGLRRGNVLPDIAFDGIDEQAAPASIRLRDFASTSEKDMVVISVHGGAWCGTCVHAARDFESAIPEGRGDRIGRLEVVVHGRDNDLPSIERDARAWQSEYAPEVAVALDPTFVFVEALEGIAAPLPLVLLVDTATLRIDLVLSNPDPTELNAALAEALARKDGLPAPEHVEPELVNELFLPGEWKMLEEMAVVPSEPPADPSNEVADSAEAAALGEALFHDTGLSPSGTVACASCHDPARAWSDGRPLALGVEQGLRRTPSIALAAHARWQSWDGKADSIWAQALAAFENDREFASSRTFVASRVLSFHRERFVAAFPSIGLEPAGQDAITAVFVAAGKSIEAYLRTIRVAPSRFDRYVAGDPSALTSEEALGVLLFTRSGCTQCHWGPRLTNDAFHRTGLGDAARLDDGDARGRLGGLAAYRDSEFRADGKWSASSIGAPLGDASSIATTPELTRGRWKTPPLRGAGEASFFGRHGDFDDLGFVTEGYAFGEACTDAATCPHGREPWIPDMTETAAWGIVPFLRTLTISELP